MYRIMACDLDGTLLREDKTISEETKKELERIAGQGVIILPSTGRTHREMPPALKDLPFLRYALCCNGGAVYDFTEDRYIYEDSIPYELALEVFDHVKTLPVYETVVVNGVRLAKADESGEVCDYIRKVAVRGILFNLIGARDVKEAFAAMHLNAQKFLLYLAEGADRQEVIDDLAGKFPQLSVSSSGPLFIEVNIKGVDKGKALIDLCRMMDIPVEESIAFGDAENDISMLKAAGMAVVMENGTPETKQYADMICPSNDDDGVCWAIKKL